MIISVGAIVRFGSIADIYQFRKKIFYTVVTDYGSAPFLPRYNCIGSQRRATKMYPYKMSKKERDDVALSHEFWDRLCAYRAALRSASTWGTPGPENMDINTTAYMVAIKIGDKYSFSKVLSELVANQDALRPDIRRFLVKRLRLCAELRRRQAQSELAAANHWNAVADQFKEDEDVTPQPPPPAWLNRQAYEPANTRSNLV